MFFFGTVLYYQRTIYLYSAEISQMLIYNHTSKTTTHNFFFVLFFVLWLASTCFLHMYLWLDASYKSHPTECRQLGETYVSGWIGQTQGFHSGDLV